MKKIILLFVAGTLCLPAAQAQAGGTYIAYNTYSYGLHDSFYVRDLLDQKRRIDRQIHDLERERLVIIKRLKQADKRKYKYDARDYDFYNDKLTRLDAQIRDLEREKYTIIDKINNRRYAYHRHHPIVPRYKHRHGHSGYHKHKRFGHGHAKKYGRHHGRHKNGVHISFGF